MKTLNEYVLNYADIEGEGRGFDRFFIDVVAYARFLNQTPKLGDFIPCDEDGNVLDEPKGFSHYAMMLYMDEKPNGWVDECKQYQAALGRVKFEGFEVALNQGMLIVASSQTTSIRRIDNLGMSIFKDNHWKEINTLSDLCNLVTLKEKKG